MHPGTTTRRRPGRGQIAAAVALAVAFLGQAPAARADHPADALPLGDADLTETRVVERVARGVTLTRIARGDEPAAAEQIATTSRGPWTVNVLTIDPARTRARLRMTHGPDLAATETTTDLVRFADALAGVNASFFTYTANPAYPGDPIGLSVVDGRVLSEPTANPAEVHLLVDADRNKVTVTRLRWKGTVRNLRTRAVLPVEFINHPPVVPATCTALADQTRCTAAGDVVRFTPDFAAATPSGPGVEVVLDRRGCVVSTASTRGTALGPDQTSLQATGSDTVALLSLARGCPRPSVVLTDEPGRRVRPRPGLFAVTGRYRLLARGQIVAPTGLSGFFARNPRTLAGTTADGRIVLATIDGRASTSVGTTLAETAAVAASLGLREAVNLDGGGSTTMSVHDILINRPSTGGERPVGDALVLVEAREHRCPPPE